MTAPHSSKLLRDSEHRDPMRIRVVHETVYRYDSPARGLIQMLRLTRATMTASTCAPGASSRPSTAA